MMKLHTLFGISAVMLLSISTTTHARMLKQDGEEGSNPIIITASQFGDPCSVELQMAFKSSTDEEHGEAMCQAAAEFLTSKVTWGLDDEQHITFECKEVTLTDVVEGLSGLGPMFGGLGAYNNYFGIMKIVSMEDVQEAALGEFYAALDFAGGLAALAEAIEYPEAWRNCCCSDPVMLLEDSCLYDHAMFGNFNSLCAPCFDGNTNDDSDGSGPVGA